MKTIQRKTPKLALSSKAEFEGTVANLCRQINSITTMKTHSNCFLENKYLYKHTHRDAFSALHSHLNKNKRGPLKDISCINGQAHKCSTMWLP